MTGLDPGQNNGALMEPEGELKGGALTGHDC